MKRKAVYVTHQGARVQRVDGMVAVTLERAVLDRWPAEELDRMLLFGMSDRVAKGTSRRSSSGAAGEAADASACASSENSTGASSDARSAARASASSL